MPTPSFSTTGLRPELLAALPFKPPASPTPVQAQAIPAVLRGLDMRVCAPTGSGKTGAFAWPLLDRLLDTAAPSAAAMPHSRPMRAVARKPRVLVLVPTRELATQVGTTFRETANRLPLDVRVTVVFGGVSINPQMLGLRGGTDVVVATPGRLLDLLAVHALTLDGVQSLVLDEADRLLDQGFADEWARIERLLPRQRQNLLFSATFSPEVQALADGLLREPQLIEVLPQAESAPDIVQRAVAVDPKERTQLLRHLVDTEHWRQVLVFVATQHAADIVSEKLRKARISAEPFHAGLSQGKRTQVLADFKLSRVRVVVATDVAARGLDIAELPVVINYDLPRSADDYTHRIGRTGRAGALGLAVSFVTPEASAHWQLLVKRHSLDVPVEVVGGFEPTPATDERLLAAPPVQPALPATSNATGGLDPAGGIKGRRPSKKDKLRQQGTR
ncbi:MAG: DEAD/DEAH box helicase [Burkholderiaceae bacterium]|nr:DEAD/DEAH box helicase [Burkholderiaceae bacterium]